MELFYLLYIESSQPDEGYVLEMGENGRERDIVYIEVVFGCEYS